VAAHPPGGEVNAVHVLEHAPNPNARKAQTMMFHLDGMRRWRENAPVLPDDSAVIETGRRYEWKCSVNQQPRLRYGGVRDDLSPHLALKRALFLFGINPTFASGTKR